MSWTVSAMGKGEAVGREITKQFERIVENIPMDTRETVLRETLAIAIREATVMAPHLGLIVEASGTQSVRRDELSLGHLNLELKIRTVQLAE